MLVNGVDISMLEGWMLKINSNPSFFGKNMSRRWFKVGFAASGSAGRSDQSHQKLIISYSTNKTSKEPRGWLYVEDVSGVYCRRDMIEIVSPARMLRLKGETTAEHRLWSDSLYRLCNPPPAQPSAPVSTPVTSSAPEKMPVSQLPPVSEAKREERRREEREAAAPMVEVKAAADRKPSGRSDDCMSSSRSLSAKETTRQVDSRRRRQEEEEEEEEEDEHQPSEEEERDAHREGGRGDCASARRPVDSPPRFARRVEAESPRPRRNSDVDSRSRGRRRSGSRESSRDASDRSEMSDDDREAKSNRRRASSMDSGECDEDDNNRGVRPPQLSKRPSLLVASIKAASPCIPGASTAVAVPQSPKFSEDEDEAGSPKRFGAPRSIPKPKQEPTKETDDPQEDSPRTDDQDTGRTNRPPSPTVERRVDVLEKSDAVPTKRNNREYFDSEEEDDEDDNRRYVARPTTKEPPTSVTAPRSEVARDNNFVDDNWDAEEDAGPAKASTNHMAKKPVPIGVGNVAADTNFATEDWDD